MAQSISDPNPKVCAGGTYIVVTFFFFANFELCTEFHLMKIRMYFFFGCLELFSDNLKKLQTHTQYVRAK